MSWCTFAAKYVSTPSFRREVEAARSVVRAGQGTPAQFDASTSSQSVSVNLSAKYFAYTRSEFAETFGCPPEVLNVEPTRLNSEEGIMQEFYLVRANEPRIVRASCSTSIGVNTPLISGRSIRAGQATDAFGVVVQSDTQNRNYHWNGNTKTEEDRPCCHMCVMCGSPPLFSRTHFWLPDKRMIATEAPPPRRRTLFDLNKSKSATQVFEVSLTTCLKACPLRSLWCLICLPSTGLFPCILSG